jgi:AcrR family transcriptional regulator
MGRPRSEAARAAMVEGARRIITTEGVRACTVEAVARLTGIARTTIYRHVGGTDGLVLAAVDGMVRAAEPPDTGSLREDLREIQRRYVAVARNPRMRELFWWLVARSLDDREFAERFRSVRVQPQGSTVVALQRAIARGELAPTVDVELALHLIQGPFLSKRFVENEDVSDAEVAALVDLVVDGLARSSR